VGALPQYPPGSATYEFNYTLTNAYINDVMLLQVTIMKITVYICDISGVAINAGDISKIVMGLLLFAVIGKWYLLK